MNREELLKKIPVKKRPDEVPCPKCEKLMDFYGAFGCTKCGWTNNACC